MTLSPGTRLGPYEILAAAGSGGMGEVYRARDARLDRIVAIKVLPEALLQDPGRRQRLEREARAVSSLSHPHICTLHDIGHQDGVDYLVMEYLEGETLAERVQKGALPTEQVLRCAIEISGALDAAHRQGIVHRDLKPGNIMLTRSGAKLLDFGLAKAAPSLAAGANLTAEATRSMPITQEGTVVGTYQYMSPEQIEGREVDARSDLFSFGSVLYEMVTARRAFPGKSQLSVASAILEKEPEPIASLRPLTPPALDHAVRGCLAKDPEDRWQTARDLQLELKWIAEAGAQASATGPATRSRKLRERTAWTMAALGIAIAAITVVGWWRGSRESRPNPPLRLSAELTQGKILDRFAGAQLALSPDGMRIIVAEHEISGRSHLTMRSLDQSEFTPLAGTEEAFTPFFSPDGKWVAFFADGKLKKIPVQGGTPITLCDAPSPRGGSWGDDGEIVVAFNYGSNGLARVPSGGGAPTTLTQLDKDKKETAHAWPQVLPGGQTVLFMAYANDVLDEGEIIAVSIKTGERKTVHHGSSFARYLPSGHLVYLRGNTLLAEPFDVSRLVVTGAPQVVLEEVNVNGVGAGDFDFSQTGTLLFANSDIERSFPYAIWWLDSAGHTEPLHVTPGLYENPRFSPDGKRLAVERPTGPSTANIWIKDLERDTLSSLTHLPGRNNYPVWAPDGRSIVFSSVSQAAPGLYSIRSDGAGEAHRLIDTSAFSAPESFSPDGKQLAYSDFSVTGNLIKIWIAPVEGTLDLPRLGKAEQFQHTSYPDFCAAYSPDGHWMAYTSQESGKFELYVRPLPGPGGKTQISTGGGSHPIWSRSDHNLYFLTPDWRIMSVGYTVTGDSFAAGKPQVWSEKKLAYLGGCYPYDLAPDGKRFAVVLNPAGTGDLTDSVTILLNFFDDLRRKVPTGRN